METHPATTAPPMAAAIGTHIGIGSGCPETTVAAAAKIGALNIAIAPCFEGSSWSTQSKAAAVGRHEGGTGPIAGWSGSSNLAIRGVAAGVAQLLGWRLSSRVRLEFP